MCTLLLLYSIFCRSLLVIALGKPPQNNNIFFYLLYGSVLQLLLAILIEGKCHSVIFDHRLRHQDHELSLVKGWACLQWGSENIMLSVLLFKLLQNYSLHVWQCYFGNRFCILSFMEVILSLLIVMVTDKKWNMHRLKSWMYRLRFCLATAATNLRQLMFPPISCCVSQHPVIAEARVAPLLLATGWQHDFVPPAFLFLLL